jgi:hypothetical protein
MFLGKEEEKRNGVHCRMFLRIREQLYKKYEGLKNKHGMMKH